MPTSHDGLARKNEPADRLLPPASVVVMPAGHFVYIPAILLFGLVAGWILGSRAAADAYAAELRRREERAAKKKARG